jgi:hypothetical protein
MLDSGMRSPCLIYAKRLPSFSFLYFVTSLRPYLALSLGNRAIIRWQSP